MATPPVDLVVPTFRIHTMPNEAASKAAGRPIFQDMEIVEIRFPGDRQKVFVAGAHEAEPNATRLKGETVTYAMLYNEQYRRFKAMETQDVSGTPLSELPFLTEGKRRELKALNVHTAEALASLDGTPLRQLGMGGREMKTQAEAYLRAAAGSADVTAMAAENAALRQQLVDQRQLIENYATKAQKTKFQKGVERSIARQAEEDAEAAAERQSAEQEEAEILAELETGPSAQPNQVANDSPPRPLESWTNAELKQFIKDSGQSVQGNPSHETLVARVMEITRQDAV